MTPGRRARYIHLEPVDAGSDRLKPVSVAQPEMGTIYRSLRKR